MRAAVIGPVDRQATAQGTDIVQQDVVALGVLRAHDPQGVIAAAQQIATPLAALVNDRQLYVDIGGHRYVRCEAWTTMAAMLGVTPHEVSVTESDGVFTATVELRRLGDGMAVARASAECGGADDGTWAEQPRNARRSMALTRATAKACRLAFSWIMVLAGYEPTPAEEMPAPPSARPARQKPVDQSAEEPVVPFGRTKGTPLSRVGAKELKRLADWTADKRRWETLHQQIQAELARRAGAGEPAAPPAPEPGAYDDFDAASPEEAGDDDLAF